MLKFLIYGLVDPRDGCLRYVGKSTTGLHRPRSEFARVLSGYEGAGHRLNWFRELREAGQCYKVVTIQELDSVDILDQAEVFWIAYFRGLGFPLVNDTDGGGGWTGRRHSAATRARMATRKIGNRNGVGGPGGRGRACWDSVELGRVRELRARGATVRSIATATGLSKSQVGRILVVDAAGGAAEVQAVARAGRRPPFEGHVHSDEAKVKIARSRGVRPFVDQNGVRYETISQAGRALGLHISAISRVLRGLRESTGGYVFVYVEAA